MEFRLPKIYPFTDTILAGVSHAEQVRHLSAAGARLIQLREKKQSSSEFTAAAVEAIEAARAFGTKIMINDRVDIAMLVGADGVHLGQDDLPPEAARRLLGDRAIIGLSTHTIDQVEKAIKLPIDYLAFGPIFQTATKADADPVVGLQPLRLIREIAGDLSVVAIGGIGRSNLLATLNAGADSVAVISAVLGGPAPIGDAFAKLAQIANPPTS
ncbi:thiamine phosphate synthase [soil metagenome]